MKSTVKPKDFAKKNISCGKHKYDNSTAFVREYFGNSPELLVNCLKDYRKHNGSHSKEEHYLTELLKD